MNVLHCVNYTVNKASRDLELTGKYKCVKQQLEAKNSAIVKSDLWWEKLADKFLYSPSVFCPCCVRPLSPVLPTSDQAHDTN
jgi:hypothetical protein